MKQKWTLEMKEQVVQDYLNGLSVRAITKKYRKTIKGTLKILRSRLNSVYYEEESPLDLLES